MKKPVMLVAALLSVGLLSACNNGNETHTHTYGDPTFSWDEFNLEKSTGEVYAVFKCKTCENAISKRATIEKEIKEPTCTEGGYKKYTATFSSPEFGEKTYSDHKEISFSGVAGHDMVFYPRVEPTCQRPGNIAFYTCRNCEKQYKDVEGKEEISDVSIAKLEHQMTYFPAKAKTCDTDGCLEHYHCSICNLDFEDKDGNRPLSEAIIAKGHELVFHEEVPATCCKDGNVAYYECNVCHKTFDKDHKEISSVIIPKLKHTLHEHEAAEATCLTPGNIHYWSCETCSNLFKDAEAKEIVTEVATYKDHEWSSSSGYCKNCSSRNMMNCIDERTTGTVVEKASSDLPFPFKKSYYSTGEVGGGTKKFFKEEDVSQYSKIEFAIKTEANPDNNERFFLKVWEGDTEIFKSQGWVKVFLNRVDSTTWKLTSSTGIDKEITGGNLYALLNLHEPEYQSQIRASNFYISEVIAYATDSHIHEFGDWVEETTSSCHEHGHIKYRECEYCGLKQDVNGEIVSSVEKPLTDHNYDANNQCTVCHKKIFSYSEHLQAPANISDVTGGSVPKTGGFNYVYYYNTKTGGGQTGGFFKHEGITGLGSTIVKMEFAVKAFDSSSNIRIRNNDGGAQHSLGLCSDWTYVTFTLNQNKTKYVCTNSANTNIVECPANSSMFAIYQLLNDSSMYITEYLFTYSD